MRIQVVIKDFDGFAHLREFIQDRAEVGFSRFEQSGRPMQANIIVGRESHKTSPNHPNFYCEVTLRRHGVRKAIVTKSRAQDFYQAVRDSIHKAERVLGRVLEMRRALRRVETEVELQPPSIGTFARVG